MFLIVTHYTHTHIIGDEIKGFLRVNRSQNPTTVRSGHNHVENMKSDLSFNPTFVHPAPLLGGAYL